MTRWVGHTEKQGQAMGFGEAIQSGFKKTFVYQGRASRSEFWWFQLFSALSCIVLGIVFVIAVGATSNGQSGDQNANPVAAVLVLLFFLYLIGMVFPHLSLAIRRLHDSDKSGAFILLTFVPFGGLVLLVFYCLAGTRGPNKFGDDPKRPLAGVF